MPFSPANKVEVSNKSSTEVVSMSKSEQVSASGDGDAAEDFAAKLERIRQERMSSMTKKME